MPVTHRQRLLALTAAAALLAAPAAAWAQGSAGTSRMPQTEQTTPQQGPIGGSPGARAGANAGQGTTQTIPGNTGGAPRGGEAPDRQVPEHMRGQGHTSTQGQQQGGGSGGACASKEGCSRGFPWGDGSSAP